MTFAMEFGWRRVPLGAGVVPPPPPPPPDPEPDPGSSARAWAIPSWFRAGGKFPVGLVGDPGEAFSTTYDPADFEDQGATYHVAVTGDDATGDGSVGAPWRSIQHAIDTVASGSRISVGPGRFGAFTLSAKNLSIQGAGGQTYVGDMLTGADITFGAPASGRQTVTLASGTVQGFVDLTVDQRGHKQVARTATTAAAIATFQAAGDAGCFRSTPSQVGASDGRDLAGSADGDVIFWASTAAAPFVLASAAKLFARDIIFVGGATSTVAAGTRAVLHDCQMLGATGQNFTSSGTSIIHGGMIVGSAVTNQDVLDYESGAVFVEIDMLGEQGGAGAADNISTHHNGFGLRVGGTYRDSSRPIHDTGPVFIGNFDITVEQNGSSSKLAIGGANSSSEMHCAGITFAGASPTDMLIDNTGGGGNLAFGFFYDQSFAGRSVSGGSVTDRSGAAPEEETYFVLDPSNLATLWQDIARATPVAADGDPVMLIDCAAGTGGTITTTSAAGTAVYHTDGTKHWITYANAYVGKMLGTVPMAEETQIVLGLRSSDTSAILMAYDATNTILDIRSSNALGKGQWTAAAAFRVDGGATDLAAANTLRAAAFDGQPHVLSTKAARLAWCGWLRASVMSSTASGFGLDGDVYGFELTRFTSDDDLAARVAGMAVKAGATLPG